MAQSEITDQFNQTEMFDQMAPDQQMITLILELSLPNRQEKKNITKFATF
jgi:hypothetical protein